MADQQAVEGEKISEKIKSLPPSSEYFSLEFFPPKTQAGTQNLLPRLARLAQLSPLFVTVTWGAGGSTAEKSLDLAEILQQQYGLTTCLHLTCTNMRQRVLDDALERCKAIGIRNLLALRGDEPRPGEYAEQESPDEQDDESFEYAVDLVRYIRRKHGDYFCIGVAGYPEGHATGPYSHTRDVAHDLPFLAQKTQAGADFIMTQLFYDSAAFLRFVSMLQKYPDGIFKNIPVIPGLMPIQNWGTLRRVTKLSGVSVPQQVFSRLDSVKADDEAVKELGIEVITELVRDMNASLRDRSPGSLFESSTLAARGYHFYTLNLEKAVAQILERCSLVKANRQASHKSASSTCRDAELGKSRTGIANEDRSSDAAEGATPRQQGGSNAVKAVALSVAEGEGSLGREATWDDFPNGRWGDTRSPAYGSIDGYGPTLHVSRSEAIDLWGQPTSYPDITNVFRKYLRGEISANPWSEETLSAETALIQDRLIGLTEKGWWTLASQPAVNAASSADEVVGWGPKVGGWVWQKPFVEFFIPRQQWSELKEKLLENDDQMSFFAGNARGDFDSNNESSVNTVTWGAFKDKEIISPTIIDAVSFRAWQDEAFGIWREWQRVYPAGSPSNLLIGQVRNNVWLVNVICHEYMNPARLWDFLMADLQAVVP